MKISQTSNKVTLDFVNYLYVIGALLVVLGHATANYLGNWGPPNTQYSFTAVALHDYIYTFHMPMFFFISGYVMEFNCGLGKYRKFNEFVVTKFLRLMVPYILVGFFYVSPLKLIMGDYNINNYVKSMILI